MSENVITLPTVTTLDTEPKSVLQAAIDADIDQVFVIGVKDGELYAAGSTSSVGDLLVLVEKFKREVIE